MQRRLFQKSIIAVSVCAFFSSALLAQTGDLEYGYGTIAKVNAEEIVVNEYNLQSDQESVVTYQIDETTQFDNEVLLADLHEGQHIEIDYLPQGEKKIAKIISLETKNEPEMPTL